MSIGSSDVEVALSGAFDPWPQPALEAMHEASLRVLECAGVGVESARARALLLDVGCEETSEGRIRMPSRVIEAALELCPEEYVLAAREPCKDLSIDPRPAQTYVHNMGGAAHMADPRTGVLRRATPADQARLCRIMHRLAHVDAITPMVTPDGVPDTLESVYSLLIMAAESDACLLGPGISHMDEALALIDMARVLTGADGSGGRYCLGLMFSPVSPLHWGEETADALIAAARSRSVACAILPCPAVATTAPATLAAAIAQQNAELLAGVVLVQAAAAGTPTYCAPRLTSVDPRTGLVASGGPETGLASLAAVMLARRYGLAADCYGPVTDSKIVDGQFCYEHSLNALLGLLARPRILSGLGDMHAGAATSPEALVVDDEILTHVFYATTPRPWDPGALDVDAMVEGALSAAGFLATKHTRRYVRSELLRPTLSYRGGLQKWLDSGRPSVLESAEQRVTQLAATERVGLPDAMIADLCAIIDQVAAARRIDDRPDPRALLDALS